jgi:hypothetical protein
MKVETSLIAVGIFLGNGCYRLDRTLVPCIPLQLGNDRRGCCRLDCVPRFLIRSDYSQCQKVVFPINPLLSGPFS